MATDTEIRETVRQMMADWDASTEEERQAALDAARDAALAASTGWACTKGNGVLFHYADAKTHKATCNRRIMTRWSSHGFDPLCPATEIPDYARLCQACVAHVEGH